MGRAGRDGTLKPAGPHAPSARVRMQWLLEFLRRDVDALTPGELLDLRLEIVPFGFGMPVDERPAGDTPAFPDDDTALKVLGELQLELRGAMEALDDGRMWLPFGITDEQRKSPRVAAEASAVAYWNGAVPVTPKPPPVWVVEPFGDGLHRRYSGDFDTLFRLAAEALLIEFWPLRRCKYEGCQAWFLPRHGRQRYHTPSCRQQKFSSTRQRDYKAEYRDRRKQELGANVRIGKEPRRRRGKR